MVEQETSGLERPAQKKKKKKGWIVALVIIGVLITPLILVVAFFYDTSMNKTNVSPDTTFSEIFNSSVVDSLSHTTETGHERMEVAVNQDAINQVFYNVLSSESLPAGLDNYIPQVDVKIKDNYYDFYFYLRYNVLATKIVLKTTLTVENRVNPITSEEDPYLIFKIRDIQIGRLGGMASVAFKIAGNFINDKTIENLLSSYLRVESHLNERELVYDSLYLFEDIALLTNSGGSETTKLYYTILNDLVDNGLLTFDFKSAIKGTVGLSTFMENDYAGGGYDLHLDDNTRSVYLDSIRQVEEKMMKDELITTDLNEMKNLYSYLFHGYGFDSSVDSFMDTMNDNHGEKLATYFSDYTAYKGMDIATDRDKKDLYTIMTSNINLGVTSGGVLTYLTETDINHFLASVGVIGTGYFASVKDADGNYTIAYIVFDNLYVNIVKVDGEDYLYFTYGININGCETILAFLTKYVPSTAEEDKLVLNFVTQDVYYGELDASDYLKSALFNIVSTILESKSIMGMSMDPSDLSISIDFNFDSVVTSAIATLGGSAEATVSAPDTIASSAAQLQIMWSNI